MRLSLWKRILITLLLPVPLILAVILYAFWHIGKIHQRVDYIKIADDINLSVIQLRRYEEDILLFMEEDNIKKFYDYLERIDRDIRNIEDEILTEINKTNYLNLLEDLRIYKESSDMLISSIRTEQMLLEDIRPLGRRLEDKALSKEAALELRRYEKNYIIYREQQAIDKVNQLATDLKSRQLVLTLDVDRYLEAFNSLIKTESLKESSISNMRLYGQEMEGHLAVFSKKEREEIDRNISTAKKLFVSSFIFLIMIGGTSVYLIIRNMVKHLKSLEESLDKLGKGDYNHSFGIISTAEEISSLTKTFNTTVERLRDSKEELDRTLKSLEDTNRELVERQDELVEARKISAMRLLASEIAHEINNPLSSLILFLRMLFEDEKNDLSKKNTFELMLKEVTRCQVILRELVDFARKEPMQLRDVNPVKLINDAIGIIDRQQRERGITLKVNLGELPSKAVLDPVLINQAILNILTNAHQHTPNGGTIEVQGSAKDGIMTITIRDKGTGISEEDIPYVFEPFFSTRKDLGGSGLGLAITRKILERHNGSIHVESRLGEETVFKIILPVSQG